MLLIYDWWDYLKSLKVFQRKGLNKVHWTPMCCEGFRGQGRKVILGYVNCVSSREPESIVHRTQTLLLQGGHFYFSLKHEASVEGENLGSTPRIQTQFQCPPPFETKVSKVVWSGSLNLSYFSLCLIQATSMLILFHLSDLVWPDFNSYTSFSSSNLYPDHQILI